MRLVDLDKLTLPGPIAVIAHCLGFDRHAGPQEMLRILVGIETNPHWEPLNKLTPAPMYPSCLQRPVKLLGFLAVSQSPFGGLTGVCVHKCNLLESPDDSHNL